MKIAIGCHVMWYEIEMIEEYVESLRQLVEQIPMEHRANIYIDFYLNVSQHFEKMESDSILQVVKDKFTGIVTLLYSTGVKVTYDVDDKMYFIGDYRRDFNNKFAPKTDFLIWAKNSIIVSFIVTLTGVVFASTGGYALSRFRFRGRQFGMIALDYSGRKKLTSGKKL